MSFDDTRTSCKECGLPFLDCQAVKDLLDIEESLFTDDEIEAFVET